MEQLLAGRTGLITGVANARSLAWAIAEAAHAAGARLVLTYQSERLRANVEALAQKVGATAVLPLDVAEDADLAALPAALARSPIDALDFVVHGTAYAPKEALTGRFVDTRRAAFAETLDVSAYALVALAQTLLPWLRRGQHPSLLTLSYLGAERAMPNYNVMGVAKAALEACVRYLAADLGPDGIRVNAISAGPVRTLSAAGIAGFRTMLHHAAEAAPLRRNIEAQEVGDAALFALSALGRGMTGEVFHVDAGYHVQGAPGHAAAPQPPPV